MRHVEALAYLLGSVELHLPGRSGARASIVSNWRSVGSSPGSYMKPVRP
jgi:hypothetical protein